MAEIEQSGARGVVVAQDGLFYANMPMLAQLAIEHQLAMMAYAKEMVEAGALISYGADIPAYFRGAGKSIDQILGPFPDFTGKGGFASRTASRDRCEWLTIGHDHTTR